MINCSKTKIKQHPNEEYSDLQTCGFYSISLVNFNCLANKGAVVRKAASPDSNLIWALCV